MKTREEKHGDRVYTPDHIVVDIVTFFKPCGRVLEPFAGAGAFLARLPTADWCEIDRGRDFFLYQSHVDWIVSNPPYSLTREAFRHAATLADHIVYLLPLRNVFSGFGFVKEIQDFGGFHTIRVYGTGGSIGFPMGNAVGAFYWQKGYRGLTDIHIATGVVAAEAA